jgi:DNA-directed RNA polymerase sigma subunit (sigma70/sigma32)
MESILDCLPSLNQRLTQVVYLKILGYTLAEIGDRFSKTKEWARKELNKAIGLIREANDTKKT